MPDILQTAGLAKCSAVCRPSPVSTDGRRGRIHYLIGPNSAGKSTLFKLVMGTYPPTAGTIAFRGEDITGRRSTSACSAA